MDPHPKLLPGAARLFLCALCTAGLLQGCTAPSGSLVRSGATGLLVLEEGRPALTLLGTSEVRQRLSVATGNTHCAVSPSGALGALSVPGEGRVQLLDVSNMRRGGDIELGIDQRPSGLVFIDEEKLLIGSANSGRVALYDSSYGRVIRVLESGGASATELSVDPVERTLWVLDSEDGRIARMGWTRPELRRSAHLGDSLTGLVHRPGSNELWVLSSVSNRIIIIAKDSLELQGEIACASGPVAVAFDDEDDAWVVCRDSNEVVRIDAETGALRSRIPIPSGPGGAAAHPIDLLLEPDAQRAWIACPGSGTLQIIDQVIERCVSEVDGLLSPICLLPAPSADS